MNKQRNLIVIVGPTASGKTALSVKLAKYFDTEILSADSRQIYKELTIGTAKPTNEEMDGVKHYFINSHSIEEDYNIGKYEKDALEVLDKVFENKNSAILVGGSGLYVKVVCEGMDEMPDVDIEIREELNNRYVESGIGPLLQELEKIDPDYYAQVEKSNKQRVIRGIEVFKSTGIPFSQFRTGEKKQRDFNILKIGLLWDRQELYDRIDQRMDLMIEAGLFEEAESLLGYKDKNALQTVGYREIFDFLEGNYDRDEAVRLLKRNTRRYAKRQMTWFNRDEEIKWFDAKDQHGIIEFVEKKIGSSN